MAARRRRQGRKAEPQLLWDKRRGQNWMEEYTRRLLEVGFVAGFATPCNFVCGEKELRVTVHGDDFTATGPTDSLQWLERGLAAAWEIKSEYLGPGSAGCETEVRVLN